MRTFLVTLLATLLAACGAAPAFAATPIPLTTPAGVCQFQATAVTAVPDAFAATGNFGPGCPGYVAPPDTGGGGLPANCPTLAAGRLGAGSVKFVAGNVTKTVDLMHYDGLFGSAPGSSGVTPWPGLGGNVITVSLNATQYVALEFTTPANMAPTRTGNWTFTQTGSTGQSAASLSQCPGDFSPSSTYCYSQGGEGAGVAYAGKPSVFTCQIKPGTRYYLNLRMAPGAVCPSGRCAFSIKHSIFGQ
jgi:putative hemolysin